jgi:hypothetical protein
MSFGLGEQYLAILYLRSSFQLLRKRTDTPYWKKEHRNIVRINEEKQSKLKIIIKEMPRIVSQRDAKSKLPWQITCGPWHLSIFPPFYFKK